MFSVVKFVVASAIVALFGGLVFAGIFTTQQGDEMLPAAVTASPAPEATSEPAEPSGPSVRNDILPGVELTVEEVEPGVYRVVGDGVRDLAKANDTDIVAGHDGGIWLLRPQRFVRLGSDEWYRWATRKPIEIRDFEVAPDGAVWTIRTQHPPKSMTQSFIESFDGEEWTRYERAEGGATLEVTPDGTVWAIWPDPDPDPEQQYRPVFGYLADDGWQTLGQVDEVRTLLVASLDDIWATGGGGWFAAPYVIRFVDGAWQRLVGIEGTEASWQPAEDPVGDDAEGFGLMAGVGPDGTFWATGGDGGLVRFDGNEWGRWSSSDIGLMPFPFSPFGVASDGSVWFAVVTTPDDFCEGVGHFDGGALDRYLEDLCVEAIDVAADGAVWLLAKESGDNLRHVYVITSEAVAAST